jgi:hypothetical protein
LEDNLAATFDVNQRSALKDEYLEAYRANGGYAFAAARKIGVAYSTAKRWIIADPDFAAAREEIKGIQLDRAEAELYERAISDDKDTCLIFYLKTKGKERGYYEKVENDFTGLKMVNEYKTNEADEDLKARIIAEYEASKLLSKPPE